MPMRLRTQVQGLLRPPALTPQQRSTWCVLHPDTSARVRQRPQAVSRSSGLPPRSCPRLLPKALAQGSCPRLLPKALAIRDWLLTEAAQLADPGQISPGFAERLIAVGIPINRIMSVIDLLHSEYAGVGRIWTKEEGTTSRLFPHGSNRDRVYNESPFAYVHRTRAWLLLDLAYTSEERFNIILDLKAAG